MKGFIEEFVGVCDKENNDIKDFVKSKSVDEKIELRACLKEEITHSEKTNIIVFEVNFLVAILAMIVAMDFEWKKTILSGWLSTLFNNISLNNVILNKGVVVVGCIFGFLIGIVMCIRVQNKKAKYTKALSYLEDYWNEEKQKGSYNDSSRLEMETCEQTRDRFVKDIAKKVSALNEKRIEIDEEISRCDEFRNILNNFSEHD